jgi:RHS repeat-associated protein
VATATDAAGNTGQAKATLLVFDPTVTGAPTVALTGPADGAVLTAPTDVTGTASDAHLLYYTLSVAPFGSTSFTEIGRGTGSVTGGVLGKFDPSLLANDSYILRLDAVNTGGIEASTQVTVSVAGNLKLGNFALGFTDLSIPVNGIPITVSRTYDTLNAGTSDDLGYGWRLDYRDTQLHTNAARSELEEFGFFNPFRFGTRVSLTLPGGKRESFTFRPQAQDFLYTQYFTPAFVPDPGVTDQLTVADAMLIPKGGSLVEFYSGLPYNPGDPTFGGTYTLTTQDGTVYQIDGQTGKLVSATDPNNNTLTFSDDGITSSTGTHVTFDRDPQGRITAVTDPAGKQVHYRYDANGDLVAVTDRAGHVTQFVYRTDRPHYLDHVIDPLGRTGARTEYDAQGHVSKIFDASGNAVQMTYDPDHSVETVVDALGNPTSYEYDARGNIVQEVDALGGITKRAYDANNNLLSQTDPLGHTTSYTYDAAGNQITVTDPLGRVTRRTYGPLGKVLTTTDPLGDTTTNTYDDRGDLLSVTDPVGRVTRYTYDAAGNQTSLTDAAGNVTRFAYDAAGHLTRQVDALGNATTYTYDADGNQLTQSSTLTTSAGLRTLVTSTVYDAQGRPTARTDAEGNTSRTEYDAIGEMIATVDPLGRRTTYRYDERGKLVATIYPDGTQTSSEYDAAGRETARTDEAGRRTELHYDALGRLVETDYADGTRTRTEYDAAGEMTAQVDARGNRTEFEYDGAGEQTVTRDARGNTTSNTYDDAGRLVATTDALGHTTRYVLCPAGCLLETDYADGTKTTQKFDALSRVVARTDQAGQTTHYEYDALGRTTAVVDTLGQRTEYGYDEAGNLVSQKDANGHVTRYEYDGLGHRTATVLPLGLRSTTSYDEAGNVLTTTDFNGDTVRYEYDGRDRLTAKLFPDGSSFAFTYTATGQRATVSDARGTTRYTYDNRDRLLSRTDPDGTTISYSYDDAGNQTSVTTPAGTTTSTFDALNRLATVTDAAGGVTQYTYDQADNLVRTDLPNGTAEVRNYDALNRLLYLVNDGPSGVISSYRYTLDPAGNRTEVVEDTGRTVDYVYDGLYRLVGEHITDAVAGNRTIDYTYDSVGNRLTRNDSAEGQTAYTYDANDRLLTETLAGAVTQYTYDADGNTLSRVTSPTDQVVYHWNADGRLTGPDVTDASGTHAVVYLYDADGNRVASTTDGAVTRYLVDANRPYAEVLLEYSPGGVIQASYVYGRDLISQARGGVLAYYHRDGLGDTRVLTDRSGAVTDRYTYDAFGRTIRRTGNTVNAYLFPDAMRDFLVGLDYLRSRYLSPTVGRFVSRDTFEGFVLSPLTRHGYVYVIANPVNHIDPSGMDFTLVDVMVTVAVVGTLALTALPAYLRYLNRAKTVFADIALQDAKRLTALSIQRITRWSPGDQEVFRQWFGRTTPLAKQVVLDMYGRILDMLNRVRFVEPPADQCNRPPYGEGPCGPGGSPISTTLAFVNWWTLGALNIGICPAFNELPDRPVPYTMTISKADALIHEVSHILGTQDWKWSVCSRDAGTYGRQAQLHPEALNSSYSYGYFANDALLSESGGEIAPDTSPMTA